MAVWDPETGQQVAVKYFPMADFDQAAFLREVEVLSQLNHPCVLRIIGWPLPGRSTLAQIHTELAHNGSLEDVLRQVQRGPLMASWSRTRMAVIICDIVLGMRFIHSQGLIHRDLKPSNILIDENWRGMIGDLGSSLFEVGDGTPIARSGTFYYAAPELFDEHATPSGKVDVYAFGLVLYEIIAGKAVFPTSVAPFDVIRQLGSRYRPVIPRRFGPYIADLIARCWSHARSDRPSFDEIFNELQTREFDFFLGANSVEISRAVETVLSFEVDARARAQLGNASVDPAGETQR
jgi:serine/threonine protein kinase